MEIIEELTVQVDMKHAEQPQSHDEDAVIIVHWAKGHVFTLPQ